MARNSAPSGPEGENADAKAASPVMTGAAIASPRPKAPAPTSSPLSKLKTTVKIPTSLKSARDRVAEESVEEQKKSTAAREETSAVDTNLPDQDYSQEQFMDAWVAYAQQVKAAGRQGEYIVLKETPQLAEDHVVRVPVTSSMQLDFYEKAKPGTQLHLRKVLQNSQIRLEHVFVKEEEGKRLYTAHEKFGYLLKKYPQLQVLKEKLGLEADF